MIWPNPNSPWVTKTNILNLAQQKEDRWLSNRTRHSLIIKWGHSLVLCRRRETSLRCYLNNLISHSTRNKRIFPSVMSDRRVKWDLARECSKYSLSHMFLVLITVERSLTEGLILVVCLNHQPLQLWTPEQTITHRLWWKLNNTLVSVLPKVVFWNQTLSIQQLSNKNIHLCSRGQALAVAMKMTETRVIVSFSETLVDSVCNRAIGNSLCQNN